MFSVIDEMMDWVVEDVAERIEVDYTNSETEPTDEEIMQMINEAIGNIVVGVRYDLNARKDDIFERLN